MKLANKTDQFTAFLFASHFFELERRCHSDSCAKSQNRPDACQIASASEFAHDLEHEIPRRAVPVAQFKLAQCLVISPVKDVVEVQRCRPAVVEQILRTQGRNHIRTLVESSKLRTGAVAGVAGAFRDAVSGLRQQSPTYAPAPPGRREVIVGPQLEKVSRQRAHKVSTGGLMNVVGI